MKKLKLLFEILTVVFCITLSSCNGKISETEGSGSSASGDPRKEADKIMSACNYVYGASSTDNVYYKETAEKLDMKDMIEAWYKCPSSAVSNIINKLGSDIWSKSESDADNDSIVCKPISSKDANTSIEYGIYKDGRIKVSIYDCIHHKGYAHTFEKGEL